MEVFGQLLEIVRPTLPLSSLSRPHGGQSERLLNSSPSPRRSASLLTRPCLFPPLFLPPRTNATTTATLHEQDDDEEHEFSKTLAFDYIGQAETTFVEIDEALYAPLPPSLYPTRSVCPLHRS